MFSSDFDSQHKFFDGLSFFWQKVHRDIPMMIGMYGLIVLLVFCLFADFIAPYELGHAPFIPLLPPAWSNYGDIDFFFGTDSLGRDVLSQLIYATRYSFGSALLIMGFVGVIGISLGLIAGITHGTRSAIINHLFNVFLAIPSLLLVIFIILFFGPSLTNVIIAITLSFLPKLIHIISNAVREEFDKEYVVALRLDGASTWYILKDSIIPNLSPLMINELTRILSLAILDITALGFLGLGAQGTHPEWGAMLGDILDLFFVNPSLLFLPGVTIFASVLFVNLFGDGILRMISKRGG